MAFTDLHRMDTPRTRSSDVDSARSDRSVLIGRRARQGVEQRLEKMPIGLCATNCFAVKRLTHLDDACGAHRSDGGMEREARGIPFKAAMGY